MNIGNNARKSHFMSAGLRGHNGGQGLLCNGSRFKVSSAALNKFSIRVSSGIIHILNDFIVLYSQGHYSARRPVALFAADTNTAGKCAVHTVTKLTAF